MTFQKSPRFFQRVEHGAHGFWIDLEVFPALPELFLPRDFSGGDGFEEFFHGRCPDLAVFLELVHESAEKSDGAKARGRNERDSHGIVEEKGLVRHGHLGDVRDGCLARSEAFKEAVLGERRSGEGTMARVLEEALVDGAENAEGKSAIERSARYSNFDRWL